MKDKNLEIHLAAYFYKKKHTKNKQDNKVDYQQGVGGNKKEI